MTLLGRVALLVLLALSLSLAIQFYFKKIEEENIFNQSVDISLAPLLLRSLHPSAIVSSWQHLMADQSLSATSDNRNAATSYICIGDIHGYLDKLESLWMRLEEHLGVDGLADANVIFLGDYCDRGPDTRKVLDFLCHLQDTREISGRGQTIFLAGNHDFGMAAFLGVLPVDSVPAAFDMEATRPSMQRDNFPFMVEGGMHFQGKRWGGSLTYSAQSTFTSYGVKMDFSLESREKFREAVPKRHLDFLQNMQWVYDVTVPFHPGRLICVHAGLSRRGDADAQIEDLKRRDIGSRVLQQTLGRFEAMSGRMDVMSVPAALWGKALVVSGHHHTREIGEYRAIVDRSGGTAEPIEALLLPSRTLVASCRAGKAPRSVL